jgi:2Fe-2S ferredoxin
MPKIYFKNKNVTVEVDKGCSVLEAALEYQVPIYHTCGGNASCSTCRIVVLNGERNLSIPEDAEVQVLDAFDLKPPYRLGCQALLLGGDVEVEIPDRNKPPRDNKTPRLTKDSKGTY